MISGRVARLGEIAEIERSAVTPEDIRPGTLFVGLENVSGDGGLNGVRPVVAGELASSKFRFTSGHLLYGKLRPYLRKIARPNFDGICSTDILPIRPGSEITRDYLYYCLRQPKLVALATGRSSGVNLPRLSPQTLLGFTIPVPPLFEQRRIAVILDKADAIRRKREQAVELASSLDPSAFSHFFGGFLRNERGWKLEQLGGHLEFLTSGSRGWARYYSPLGKPFVRIQNVGKGRLLLDDLAYVDPPKGAEAERTTVRPGDILLSITADLGRTAVVPEELGPAHVSQHLAILRLKSLDPIFVSAFLCSPGGRRQITRLNRQGIKAALNFEDIRSIVLPCPPVSELRRFRRFWGRANCHVRHLEVAADCSRDLGNSLAVQLLSSP